MDKATMAYFFQLRFARSHNTLEVMALIHLKEMLDWS
jgi:hypothetical protein